MADMMIDSMKILMEMMEDDIRKKREGNHVAVQANPTMAGRSCKIWFFFVTVF